MASATSNLAPCNVTPVVVSGTMPHVNATRFEVEGNIIEILVAPVTPHSGPIAGTLLTGLGSTHLSISNGQMDHPQRYLCSSSTGKVKTGSQNTETRFGETGGDLLNISPDPEGVYPKHDSGYSYGKLVRRMSLGSCPGKDYNHFLRQRRNSSSGRLMKAPLKFKWTINETKALPSDSVDALNLSRVLDAARKEFAQRQETQSDNLQISNAWHVDRFAYVCSNGFGNNFGQQEGALSTNPEPNAQSKPMDKTFGPLPTAAEPQYRFILNSKAAEFYPGPNNFIKSTEKLPTPTQETSLEQSFSVLLPPSPEEAPISGTPQPTNSNIALRNLEYKTLGNYVINESFAQTSIQCTASPNAVMEASPAANTRSPPSFNFEDTEPSFASAQTPSNIASRTPDEIRLLSLIRGSNRQTTCYLNTPCPHPYPYGDQHQQSEPIVAQRAIITDGNSLCLRDTLAKLKWEDSFVPVSPTPGVPMEYQRLEIYLLKCLYHLSKRRIRPQNMQDKALSGLINDKKLAARMNSIALKNGWTEDRKLFKAAKIKETLDANIWCVVGENNGSDRTGVMMFPKRQKGEAVMEQVDDAVVTAVGKGAAII